MRQVNSIQPYFDWNDQIFEYFFPVASEERAVTLAFDDQAMGAIAMQMGVPPDGYLEAVRALVRPDSDNVFIWWTSNDRLSERDPPFYCGLLAMFSLAASQMGSELDGTGSRAFFHRHLARLLNLGSSTEFVHGFAEATRYYSALERYLQLDCSGTRGVLLRLSDLYSGGKYVAMARAQVLLTHAERRNLHNIFAQVLGHTKRLDREQLGDWLIAIADRPGSERLPVLRRVHEISSKISGEAAGAAIKEQFSKLIAAVEQEYVAWTKEEAAPRGQAAHARIGVRTHRLLPGEAETQQRVPWRGQQDEERIRVDEERSRNLIPKPLTTYNRRLILRRTSDGGLWQAQPQMRGGDSEWLNVAVLDADASGDWLVLRRPDEREEILDVGDIVAFQNDGMSWVNVPRVGSGSRAYLMVRTMDSDAVARAVATLGSNVTVKALAQPFDSRVMVGADFDFNDVSDTLPDIVAHAFSEDVVTVTLRRGLKSDGGYFTVAPPRVVFDHRSSVDASVYLDNAELPDRAFRRQEYILPKPLSPGEHTIEILGRRVTFRVCDVIVASALSIDDRMGYEVCYRYGLMRPSDEPGATRDPRLRSAAISVVCVLGSALL